MSKKENNIANAALILTAATDKPMADIAGVKFTVTDVIGRTVLVSDASDKVTRRVTLTVSGGTEDDIYVLKNQSIELAEDGTIKVLGVLKTARHSCAMAPDETPLF